MYFEPGERYAYSGEGFQYLKHVIEKLTGRPALDVITELTLEPFGMTESDLVWPSRRSNPPLALGHEKDGTPREKRASSEMNAAASLIGSPTEVARTFGVPIRWLADPDNLELKEREHLVPGRSIRVYYFKEYEGETIWGVTARITVNLLQMLDAAILPSRSAG